MDGRMLRQGTVTLDPENARVSTAAEHILPLKPLLKNFQVILPPRGLKPFFFRWSQCERTLIQVNASSVMFRYHTLDFFAPAHGPLRRMET